MEVEIKFTKMMNRTTFLKSALLLPVFAAINSRQSTSAVSAYRKEDNRLETTKVNLSIQNVFLGDLLDEVSKQTKVSLFCQETNFGPCERFTIHMENVVLADFMQSLWSFLSYKTAEWKWIRSEKSLFTYEFLRTNSSAELSAKLLNISLSEFYKSIDNKAEKSINKDVKSDYLDTVDHLASQWIHEQKGSKFVEKILDKGPQRFSIADLSPLGQKLFIEICKKQHLVDTPKFFIVESTTKDYYGPTLSTGFGDESDTTMFGDFSIDENRFRMNIKSMWILPGDIETIAGEDLMTDPNHTTADELKPHKRKVFENFVYPVENSLYSYLKNNHISCSIQINKDKECIINNVKLKNFITEQIKIQNFQFKSTQNVFMARYQEDILRRDEELRFSLFKFKEFQKILDTDKEALTKIEIILSIVRSFKQKQLQVIKNSQPRISEIAELYPLFKYLADRPTLLAEAQSEKGLTISKFMRDLISSLAIFYIDPNEPFYFKIRNQTHSELLYLDLEVYNKDQKLLRGRGFR
jgi:hypothetical protein